MGRTVIGFGFAIPLLEHLGSEFGRVINVMPKQQGVLAWPGNGPNVSVLSEETLWPIPTGYADRVLMIHGLETSGHPSAVLDECWRVLAPEGRALVIVPNRAGLWCRRDVTPFGFGRPYTLAQIESQLSKHRFVPERHLGALFGPPKNEGFWIRFGPVWERAGRKLPFNFVGGVLLVDVVKRVYAPTKPALRETVRTQLKALEGIAVPKPKPVSGLVKRTCGPSIRNMHQAAGNSR